MLSMSGGMSAGAASSYYEKEDYYLKGAENSQWTGEGAAALGLTGAVEKNDFSAICAGVDPKTGETLVSGKAQGGGMEERRAGNDLTFSAPKSVSVAFAAGVEGVKEAHDAAVSAVAAYIEQHYSQARTPDGMQSGSMVAAKFDHGTSREGDPQLHSHLFITNMTQTEDGKWRANEPSNIYRDQKTLGELYRQVLSHNLQQQGHQIQWTDRGSLQFEIGGVKEAVNKEFSARREAIEAKVAEWKAEGKHESLKLGQLYEKAALETRSAKGEKNTESVREQWQQGFSNAGTTPEQVKSAVEGIKQQNIEQQQSGVQPEQRSADDIAKSAAAALTATEATFTRAEVMKAVAEISGGKHDIKELSAAVDRATEAHGKDGHGREVRTTAEMKELESKNVESLKTLASTEFKSMTSEAEVKAYISNLEKNEGIKLSEGQQAHVINELAGRSSLAVTQGDPGTGKTFASSIVERFNNEVLKPDGREHYTLNVAFTGKATDEMSEASGKTAYTIDSFLHAYNRGEIRVVAPERAQAHQQASRGRAERMTGTAGQHHDRNGNQLQAAKAAQEQGKGFNVAQFGSTRDSGGRTTINVSRAGATLRFDKTSTGTIHDRETSTVVGPGGVKNEYSGTKHGDSLSHSRSGKGTITGKDGSKTEYSIKESGSQFLGYKKTERTERSADSIKTSKATTWGRTTKGTTTTVSRDGKVVTTKWEGQRGFFSGKFEITKSETSSRVDHVAASKAFDSKFVAAGMAAKQAVDSIKEFFGGKQQQQPSLNLDNRQQQPAAAAQKAATPAQEQAGGKQITAIPAGSQVVIKIDEASFVGAKHAEQLIQITNDLKAQGVETKILALGDTKQLQAISAGQFFAQAQQISQQTGNFAAMKEINRQKDPALLNVAKTLNRDGDKSQMAANAREAISKLDEQGRISEIKGTEELKAATVAAYMQQSSAPSFNSEKAVAGETRSTLIVTATNRDRQDLNNSIREARIEAGQIERGQKFETLQQATRGNTADSYKHGDQIQFNQNAGGVPNGVTATVTAINNDKNMVQVQYSYQRDGQERTVTKDIQADHLSQNSTAYEKTEKEFSQGDRIMMLKNDKELGVKNGQAGVVEKIECNNISVKLDNGKSVEINTQEYKNIDHGYASTVHKAQGATVESCIVHHNPEAGGKATHNSLNVAATRATHELQVLTGDKAALEKQAQGIDEKTTTVSQEQMQQPEKSEQPAPEKSDQPALEKSEQPEQPEVKPDQPKQQPAPEKSEQPEPGKTEQQQPEPERSEQPEVKPEQPGQPEQPAPEKSEQQPETESEKSEHEQQQPGSEQSAPEKSEPEPEKSELEEKLENMDSAQRTIAEIEIEAAADKVSGATEDQQLATVEAIEKQVETAEQIESHNTDSQQAVDLKEAIAELKEDLKDGVEQHEHSQSEPDHEKSELETAVDELKSEMNNEPDHDRDHDSEKSDPGKEAGQEQQDDIEMDGP